MPGLVRGEKERLEPLRLKALHRHAVDNGHRGQAEAQTPELYQGGRVLAHIPQLILHAMG